MRAKGSEQERLRRRLREVEEAWSAIAGGTTVSRAPEHARLGGVLYAEGDEVVSSTGTRGSGEEGVAARRRRAWQVAAALVGVAALVGLALLASSDPGTDVDVVTTESVPEGSCISGTSPAGGGTPQTVPCGRPGALVVVAKVPLPRNCPVGTRAVPVTAARVNLCVRGADTPRRDG